MGPCLVLGGAGFIGSHLAEALAQEGHRVKVFDRPHVDRLPLFPCARGFEVFTGDFLNPQALAPALQGTELVFHLVSTTLPKSSNDNPVYDVESNVLGSLRLLELCREQGVRKLVFVSSGGTVYGVPRTTPVAENHPTEPISSYGIHKLMVEKYRSEHTSELQSPCNLVCRLLLEKKKIPKCKIRLSKHWPPIC